MNFTLKYKLNSLLKMKPEKWKTPSINGYGRIKFFENAAAQPDTSLNYKVLFDIKDSKETAGVHTGLWKIARLLNLLKAGTIPSENIDIIAVVHGEASNLALTDKKHQDLHKSSNPNLKLLKLLKEHGVTIFVCAQSLASKDILANDINENIVIALSALMVLPNYQLKGYALMP